MDDFLPSRSWAPPSATTSSPDTSSSLPTPPQPDQWKSPPYKNRNELSRDSSYTFNKSSLFSNTSPILMQQTSPQQPPESQQQRSSYFQYTSKAYNSNINNAPSPSSSYNNSTYTPNRIENDIEEVNKHFKLFVLSIFAYCNKNVFILFYHHYINSISFFFKKKRWFDNAIHYATIWYNEKANSSIHNQAHPLIKTSTLHDHGWTI